MHITRVFKAVKLVNHCVTRCPLAILFRQTIPCHHPEHSSNAQHMRQRGKRKKKTKMPFSQSRERWLCCWGRWRQRRRRRRRRNPIRIFVIGSSHEYCSNASAKLGDCCRRSFGPMLRWEMQVRHSLFSSVFSPTKLTSASGHCHYLARIES